LLQLMKDLARGWRTIAATSVLMCAVATATPAFAPQSPGHHAAVALPDLSRVATLPGSRSMRVPVEHVWRAMCGSTMGALPVDDLMRMAVECSYNERVGQPVGDDMAKGGIASNNFNLVFDLDASVPLAAQQALDRVEAYFEAQFADPITVDINVEFDDLPPGVLGATGATFVHVSWSTAREGLQNGMDETDVVQAYLPAMPRLPVRYNGQTDVVTHESRVYWTLANFRAAVGSVGGDAGMLRFNDTIAWDYDPDDGVSGFSFMDVVIHEVGHVLGFGSGADFRVQDIEALDIFRFQRTDGGASNDYNPDTFAEFASRSRLVSRNTPNNDANSDIITAEYKMSDGVPFQASHFRNQQPLIGIMDPQLTQGQTLAPHFLRTADKRMFDAIGWDR
jgi:hypothetical protein